MAVKTITIDMDAYRTLSRLKRPGQSFSQVIKERLGHHKTGATLLQAVGGVQISNDTLDSIEKVVRQRRKSILKHPKL
jgi:predicted CopG family antitoxin